MSVREHRVGAEPRWIGEQPAAQKPPGTASSSSSKRAARDAPRPKPGTANRSGRGVTPFVVSQFLKKQKTCQIGKPGCVVHASGVISTRTRDGEFSLLAVCGVCRPAKAQEGPR